MMAAQTGVSKDPGPGTVIAGYPAREIHEWRRIEAAHSRLPELIKRVRGLEDKLESGGSEEK
jgi:UDP-3-O-[3-hydroxymyristoyl] glucosamine N-acyltransferase